MPKSTPPPVPEAQPQADERPAVLTWMPAGGCGACGCTCKGAVAVARPAAPAPAWSPLGAMPPRLALRIAVVCSRPGCGNDQAIGFTQRTETYGDLLEAIEGAGWLLKLENELVTEALCPPCVEAIKTAQAGR